MAVSPRRSSRARTSQPSSVAQQHTNSSASSVASSHAERSSRSQHKLPSPRSSVPARSPSRDDLENRGKPQPRRTRSSQDDAKEGPAPVVDDEVDEEGEEEVTRCICGSQEYPGLPVISNDTLQNNAKGDPNSSILSEDSTGWFIQCDKCKVWQHGGCVGIIDESTSPEEYFCELCRKDLHKVLTDLNGRKHSVYIPAQEKKSEPSSPEPRSKTSARRTRDGRNARVSSESFSKGRRATMNSRDSAYDEAEQLRRAIEESKRESVAVNTTGVPKGKRSRSESEERDGDAKRRRTTSGSSSAHSKNRQPEADSEEEVEKEAKAKNIRGAAARNHKAKQDRERGAARETERVETTAKRKGRADRRKGDESDQSPEPPSRAPSTKGGPPADKTSGPPSIIEPPPPKLSHHKKTGRPPTRRGRVGRNQYTKDRDMLGNDATGRVSALHSRNNSPDGEGGPPNGVTTRESYPDGNGIGRPSKPRHMNPNRTTMNDMKRRVAGILEFISHTQVEMAGLDPTVVATTGTATSTTTRTNATNTVVNNPSEGRAGGGGSGPDFVAKSTQTETQAQTQLHRVLMDLDGVDDGTFAALSSVEMMEALTRKLMRWQGEYGKWGEK